MYINELACTALALWYDSSDITVLTAYKLIGVHPIRWACSYMQLVHWCHSCYSSACKLICVHLKSSNQGRTRRRALFLLACIHPVTSYRAGLIFHPSTSSGSFGSSMQAASCIQARITHAHLFYLGWMILCTSTLFLGDFDRFLICVTDVGKYRLPRWSFSPMRKLFLKAQRTILVKKLL